jgi:hypothetical protein
MLAAVNVSKNETSHKLQSIPATRMWLMLSWATSRATWQCESVNKSDSVEWTVFEDRGLFRKPIKEALVSDVIIRQVSKVGDSGNLPSASYKPE